MVNAIFLWNLLTSTADFNHILIALFEIHCKITKSVSLQQHNTVQVLMDYIYEMAII